MNGEFNITEVESSIRSDVTNADPTKYEFFDEGSFSSFNLSFIEIKKTTTEGLFINRILRSNLLNLVTTAEEITETYDIDAGLTEYITIGTALIEEKTTTDVLKTIPNIVETTEIDQVGASSTEFSSTPRAMTKSYQRIDVYIHGEILTNLIYDEDTRSNTSLKSNIEFEFQEILESASLDRLSS